MTRVRVEDLPADVQAKLLQNVEKPKRQRRTAKSACIHECMVKVDGTICGHRDRWTAARMERHIDLVHGGVGRTRIVTEEP